MELHTIAGALDLFNNRVFDSLDTVEDHLVASLHDFELDQPRIRSITASQWTIDAASNAN
jgi:hypothetical protein